MTDDERTPPNDDAAERAVIGACLLSHEAAKEIAGLLTATDFYRPANALIFAAIIDLLEDGQPHDVVAVKAALDERGETTRAGGAPHLHTCSASVPTAANGGHYAGIVRDRAVLRAVIAAGTRTVQAGYAPSGRTGYDIADWATDQVAAVRDHGHTTDEKPTPTLDEFLAQTVDYDWIVPQLLERGDRLMLTGSEGLGKTTMVRQMAVSIAAGLNPFTRTVIEPQRVLVVDLENGIGLSQRRYSALRSAAQVDRRSCEDRLRIELRPSGIDVMTHGDARWLLRKVERYQPDVLVIGPVYRLANADPSDETAARHIAKTLDRCRANGCAVIVETHSPHANSMQRQRPVRPIGASLWLRWPEFGYGLRIAQQEDADRRRLCDLVAWRGARDERAWPERVERSHPWPWIEAMPEDMQQAGNWRAS